MKRKSGKMFLNVLVILFVMYQASGNRKATNQCASREMDLVVVMDGSISMDYGPFNEQRDFVISILSKMKFGPRATQLGVIQFSDRWNTVVEMKIGDHGGMADVLRNVSSIQYRPGSATMTGFAMHLAYEQFFGGQSKARRDAEKVILLITDGKPVDIGLLLNVVKDLKDKAVKIVTVAIGSSDNYIQRFRYIVRGISSGFAQGFKAKKDYLNYIVEDVANEICKKLKLPSPPKGEPLLQQKCFQEKKDVLFALDGSIHVDTATFHKAKQLVSKICGELDIAPSLIHVGMLQYSDALNTRFEFGLDQYTKYHQINQSLQNVFQSKAMTSDLQNALSIIDNQVFNGQDGDRISAEDYLLLFINDVTNPGDKIFEQMKLLKNKGVHVIIIGLGKPQVETADIYERMASHPSDVNFLDDVNMKHIAKDLTAITCRRVICENYNAVEKNKKDKRASEEASTCQQRSQDVLLMIDTTRDMNGYFERTLKFFTKFVKKLSIAATKTDVGLMTFGRSRKHLNLKLGKLSFENDINRKILSIRQSDRWERRADIASALKKVNREIFNTSYGGHRKEASDLILIATRGRLLTLNRLKIQNQVKRLTDKGVRIAVLDVGFKDTSSERLNAIRDLTLGARDIYPMDFRRVNAISQALLDVKCEVEHKTLSPGCFSRYRKVVFMLDSSRGLSYREVPTITTFVKDIVRKLYTNRDNIEVGFMHYSDIRTARYAMILRKWSLREAMIRIQNLRYRPGRKNFLGHALKTVRKKFFKRSPKVGEDQIIVVLAHNPPADAEKAFKISEKLRSQGVEIITVAIHVKKTTMKLNPQYRALASSSSSAHSFDFKKLLDSSMDILLNLCELNSCPKDTTKHCTPKKQDIFMIIDSSRSIGFNTYPRLKRFVRRLVNKLDISNNRTQVGILQASDHSRTQYEMKLGEFTSTKEIESVINEMAYHEGDTSYIGKGLDIAIKDNLFNASEKVPLNSYGSNNDRLEAENVLLVYTDGVFHDEQLARRQIEELKRRGVRVVIIGLGRQSRRPRAKIMLESLASTRSDVYLVNLDEPTLSVEQELNEVAQHVMTLQCENIYPTPVECSPESLDLFVVIDGSKSVGYVNFGKVKIFLKKLADEFKIGKDDAHFGVMQYGDKRESRIEFNLHKHLSNKEVSDAIEKMQFLSSGRTDTGHALSKVNHKVFNGTGVDRPRVPNILILFTDGLAHDIRLAYRQASELKAKNTRIIVIGAGKRKNEVFHQINSMATSREDAHKSDFDQLSGIVDDLLDVVCI